MKMLDDYFELQGKIYDYFGYSEDWVVIPLNDNREYFWRIEDDQVCYAETEGELDAECGQYYVDEIYRQRFLPKWVYKGDEYTMVVADTQCDGNKFLQVFNNEMRRQ